MTKINPYRATRVVFRWAGYVLVFLLALVYLAILVIAPIAIYGFGYWAMVAGTGIAFMAILLIASWAIVKLVEKFEEAEIRWRNRHNGQN